MENRRPPGNNPEKPAGGNYYKKTVDNSYGPRTYQPRNDRFQPRDNNTRDESYGARDAKPPARPENFQPRDNRYPPRDGKFQPRDNNFQPRDNRYPPRDNRYPRPDNRTDNRADNRPDNRPDNRLDNRTDNRTGGGFAPRRSFVPHGKPVPPWKRVEKPRIYDEMQITDGKHMGKFVKAAQSPLVRPTARRVREAMFKTIFRRVRAGRFLDLCAGGGTVGIEAISRGALICSFVERSARACTLIKKNLEATGIKNGHGEVFQEEAVPFLKKAAKRRRFWDVVFFDPPYDTNYDEVLSYLNRGVGIRPGGMLVIEHHAEMFFPERLGILTRLKVIILGETSLSFYERA